MKILNFSLWVTDFSHLKNISWKQFPGRLIIDALVSRKFVKMMSVISLQFQTVSSIKYFPFFCYTLDHLVLKLHFFHSFLAKTSWLIPKLGSFLAIVVDSTVSSSYTTLRKSETCFWQLISIMAFRAINFPRTKKASLRIFRRLFCSTFLLPLL